MKGKFLAVLALAGVAGMSSAQESERESARVAEVSEVGVAAVSAPQGAPFAVSRISKKELQEFSTSGQELPYLFARTPGVVAWSENGSAPDVIWSASFLADSAVKLPEITALPLLIASLTVALEMQTSSIQMEM